MDSNIQLICRFAPKACPPFSAVETTPYAELWMGTHPNGDDCLYFPWWKVFTKMFRSSTFGTQRAVVGRPGSIQPWTAWRGEQSQVRGQASISFQGSMMMILTWWWYICWISFWLCYPTWYRQRPILDDVPLWRCIAILSISWVPKSQH